MLQLLLLLTEVTDSCVAAVRHGSCYTDDQCRDPIPQQMSLMDCCCSIGQGWSASQFCQQCPLRDSGKCCCLFSTPNLIWIQTFSKCRNHTIYHRGHYCCVTSV